MTQDIPRLFPQVNADGDLCATVCMGEGSKKNQCVLVTHKLMPVLFLPGVMGTHLKCVDIFDEKPEDVTSNIKPEDGKASTAWKAPDGGWEKFAALIRGGFWTAKQRQRDLHPDATFVDWDTPILNLPKDMVYIRPRKKGEEISDPPTKAQLEAEARRRGWGSVYQESYGSFLTFLEEQLNNLPRAGQSASVEEQVALDRIWAEVAKLKLSQPTKGSGATATDTAEEYDKNAGSTDATVSEADNTSTIKQWLTAAANYKFVVYACGYNWLRDIGEIGNGYKSNSIEFRRNKENRRTDLQSRIDAAIAECRRIDVTCDQAIVLTHSMGGLVARAYAYREQAVMPSSRLLGIYHNVMPAVGAPAFYKRIRAGFGGEKKAWWDIPTWGFSVIVGSSADRASPVLLQAPGALELMPWPNYDGGKPWLGVCAKGKASSRKEWLLEFDSNELLQLQESPPWYALLPDMAHSKDFTLTEKKYDPRVNPAEIKSPYEEKTLTDKERVVENMKTAKKFQDKLAIYYFSNTIISYCNDDTQKTWGTIAWEWEGNLPESLIGEANISRELQNEALKQELKNARLIKDCYDGTITIELRNRPIKLTLSRAADPGDGTVPLASGQAPAVSVPFFEENGYDHQNSYNSDASRRAALYAILKFAAQKSEGGSA